MRYARRIPSTGPTGLAFFGAYMGAMVYGFYQIGQGNKRRKGLKMEKLQARAALIPFLQAEEDRRYMKVGRRHRAERAQKSPRVFFPFLHPTQSCVVDCTRPTLTTE